MTDHSAVPGRRQFLKTSLSAALGAGLVSLEPADANSTRRGPSRSVRTDSFRVVDAFDRPDTYYHGDGWESLTPGYWKIEDGALRRRLRTRGGETRQQNWFPWHWETHTDHAMPLEYDPSQPFGMLMRRDWELEGGYALQMQGRVLGLPPTESGEVERKDHTPGYGLIGLAFGSSTLFESWTGRGDPGDAAWMALWRDDGRFGIYDHATDAPRPARKGTERHAPGLSVGDRFTIELCVEEAGSGRVRVEAVLHARGETVIQAVEEVDAASFTDGYFGLVGRGLLDVEIEEVAIDPGENTSLEAPLNECHMAYPLGQTLEERAEGWQCRFVSLFRSEGEEAAIRIAETPDPEDGWESVPVAGTGAIVTNDFRRNTALIDAVLPGSPADQTFYYTVWKDGENVTADPRIGTDAVGAGTGFIGEVPEDGGYLGRLPQLAPPYRLCGLSCHAVTGNQPDLPDDGAYGAWWLHDQPTPEAFRHLEEYDYQVMLWEDDVWYMELTMSPLSTDDAYRVVTNTMGGPTSRWQMMRHWNVINPGDHDHGLDDVKGPEQYILRNEEGLGHDPEYLRRNFEIVSHLTRGEARPSGRGNPKRWARWQMPNEDFSLIICDGRIWRGSQETDVWEGEGWGLQNNLYDRTNPNRTLLGEEQFAWLQETVRTDPAPLLCLTGINGLHTVWQGKLQSEATGEVFRQDDRVAADYAGWVKAGSDRVIDLLGSRSGVVSVYGDVHTGSILKNTEHGLYEASFGPIGRSGSRSVKQGFGRSMTDFDGRDVEVEALYHDTYQNPDLDPLEGPSYWNVLEMVFDPREEETDIQLRIRNLVDPPSEAPRGGGSVGVSLSDTGRSPASRLPDISLLSNARVQVMRPNGRPVRAMRTREDGTLADRSLADVPPGEELLLVARRGEESESAVVSTEAT